MANTHEDGRPRIDPEELKAQFPLGDPQRQLVEDLTTRVSNGSYGASGITGTDGNTKFSVIIPPLAFVNNHAPQTTEEFAEKLRTNRIIRDAAIALNSSLREEDPDKFGEASIIFSRAIRVSQEIPSPGDSSHRPDVQGHVPVFERDAKG